MIIKKPPRDMLLGWFAFCDRVVYNYFAYDTERVSRITVIFT